MSLMSSLGTRLTDARPASFSESDVVGVAAAPPRAHRPQHALVGYTQTRIVMIFTRWAVELDQFPSVEQIISRFRVSRATAFRWRSALAETYGLDLAAMSNGPPA